MKVDRHVGDADRLERPRATCPWFANNFPSSPATTTRTTTTTAPCKQFYPGRDDGQTLGHSFQTTFPLAFDTFA